MTSVRSGILFGLFCLAFLIPLSAWAATPSLPTEPDVETRTDEQYDHEGRMFLFLFSLKGDGKVDYVTARMVQNHARSHYGNPVYYTEPYPLFYWWNNTMYNDPLMDGVNGNERVYQEGIQFDSSRYKPCVFNGQPC
ncbi:MAG: hypothetical protein ACREI3_11865 [Nitrospirales bacterium]